MSSEAWDSDEVERGLAGSRFAVRHLATVGSTNTLAIEAAQGAAPDRSVWVADEQTAGRGRGGHGWHSAPGDGLYVSVLLRPKLALAEALWISLAAGLAVQAAVFDLTGLYPDIRWPNDLLLGEKKFGGILVETAAETSGALRYAVIGIGLNVGHPEFPGELRGIATSLLLETGHAWSREGLLVELLLALGGEIDRLEAEFTGLSGTAAGTAEEDSLLSRFAEASSWVRGKAVRVGEGDGYTGVTAGLDSRGFLRVLGDDGTLHTVLSGGVRPR
ncbi:biotin--[acetyl-CoA-carboxylase] ligase [Granulicella sibirica]|uniref:Biotin--protein ligase n=1 Tax=Granulicella sibirica TaxID=2479048 RepID=A0A4V1L639_9BACT|nr:biotin--[acetyl-CoA-carboxylase] ligase [Granulicella sibirica]RXH57924.1 Biotin--protein ligase [Granulicella sibirica]